MIETKSCWPYIDIFRKYKDDINIFVETGTHYGESVQDAVRLGFKKIFSVEINPICVSHCLEKFETEIENGIVHLYLGDSRNVFPIILKEVNEQAMFWLDAHQDADFTIFDELSFINTHSIRNHTIIMDDIPLYFNEDGKTGLKNTILKINENYKFDFYPMHGKEEYQMIAYV
jgi:hypothetical protein